MAFAAGRGTASTLADALAGFYHLAGIDLVSEEIEATLPKGASYIVTEHALIARTASGAGTELDLPC